MAEVERIPFSLGVIDVRAWVSFKSIGLSIKPAFDDVQAVQRHCPGILMASRTIFSAPDLNHGRELVTVNELQRLQSASV